MRQADFERLYADHAGPLYSFLVYRTGDPALAEDVVADTFERALGKGSRFDPRRGSEKTWLYTIALNRLRDLARRAAVEGRGLELLRQAASESDEGTPVRRVEERTSLSAALGSLAPEEREAVALRFGADLSLREVAKVTRVRQTTAEGRIYRALRKLRDELG